MSRLAWLGAVALAIALGSALPAGATEAPRAEAWPAVKCARYQAAWGEALARFGRQGLSEEFLDRHAAFLASGCRSGRDVCPRSAEELALADALTVAAMNFGTASTFLPFACRG